MKKKLILILILLLSSRGFCQNIYNKFNITFDDLVTIADSQPSKIRDKILENPYNFLLNINKIIDSKVELTLVDKNNKLPENYTPPKLINLTDYNLNTRYKVMEFAEYAVNDLAKMLDDAKKDGANIIIYSTYRSIELQTKFYTNMKNLYGEKEASRRVAPPGTSQHHLGVGVDFGFTNQSYAETIEGKWLYNNAWKYGFSLSYPYGLENLTTYMWEPWHYRYIGRDEIIIQREFFLDIQYYFLRFWDKYEDFFSQNRIQ